MTWLKLSFPTSCILTLNKYQFNWNFCTDIKKKLLEKVQLNKDCAQCSLNITTAGFLIIHRFNEYTWTHTAMCVYSSSVNIVGLKHQSLQDNTVRCCGIFMKKFIKISYAPPVQWRSWIASHVDERWKLIWWCYVSKVLKWEKSKQNHWKTDKQCSYAPAIFDYHK